MLHVACKTNIFVKLCSYKNGSSVTVKGYRLVAPSAWSEPLEQPVKNVWSERQQFVSEVLPQSREEEEEMFHVALEMSRLQMQEDALRREM